MPETAFHAANRALSRRLLTVTVFFLYRSKNSSGEGEGTIPDNVQPLFDSLLILWRLNTRFYFRDRLQGLFTSFSLFLSALLECGLVHFGLGFLP